MLSSYQKISVTNWFDTVFKPKWVAVIEAKPIERQRADGQTFFSEVNATGRLRDSIELEFTDNGFRIKANAYIKWLIGGRPPTTNAGGWSDPIGDISQWQSAKGVGGSPYAIVAEIHKSGTSIWRRWQGQNSGLLDDLTSEDFIEKIINELQSAYIAEINGIMNNFANV